MGKTQDLIDSLAAACDADTEAASAAIGGKDKASESQIGDIVERVCTNADHATDAAIRDDVRAAMKSKAYTYKPEKVAA